jgi:hypothetical protein
MGAQQAAEESNPAGDGRRFWKPSKLPRVIAAFLNTSSRLPNATGRESLGPPAGAVTPLLAWGLCVGIQPLTAQTACRLKQIRIKLHPRAGSGCGDTASSQIQFSHRMPGDHDECTFDSQVFGGG